MDPRPHHEEVGENWLTERVIASRALTFHRVKHRECAHAFFSYLETLRYVPESARPDRDTKCLVSAPDPHVTPLTSVVLSQHAT